MSKKNKKQSFKKYIENRVKILQKLLSCPVSAYFFYGRTKMQKMQNELSLLETHLKGFQDSQIPTNDSRD